MRIALAITCVLMIFGMACNSKSSQPQQRGRIEAEIYTEDANAVAVRIEPIHDPTCAATASCYLATYDRGGKLAKFRIEFEPTQKKSNDEVISAVGKGRIIAVAGSDSALLLEHLKKALEVNSVPRNVKRSQQIEFEYVTLGDHLSHAAEGGFNAPPREIGHQVSSSLPVEKERCFSTSIL